MKKFKLVLLVSVLAMSFSAVAFTKDESVADVKSEIVSRLATESLDSILKAANAAGVPISVLADALVTKGQDGAALKKALIAAGYGESATIAALIIAGVEPGSVTDATAAGAGDATGGGGFTGGTTSTFSGGGGGGASRS